MDEFERLTEAYRVRVSAPVASKLDVLLSIERIHDSRVLPFLLEVLTDSDEVEDVRIYLLKLLRRGDGPVVASDRPAVASAIGDLLSGRPGTELRIQAALALGEFIHIPGVVARLNAVCLARDESIDLRYAAFTSLEQAGPTSECLRLLQEMLGDETLGRSARSVLSAWHIE